MPSPLAGVQLNDINAYGVQLKFVALPGRPCVMVTVAFVDVPATEFIHISPVISHVQSLVRLITPEVAFSVTAWPAPFVAFMTGIVISYPNVSQSVDAKVHPSH